MKDDVRACCASVLFTTLDVAIFIENLLCALSYSCYLFSFLHANLSYSQSGWTALHNAAMSGNGEAVQMLLEHGADVNIPDEVSVDVHI